MSILHNTTYRFDAIPTIKIAMAFFFFFYRSRKIQHYHLCGTVTDRRVAKAILKKNKAGGITLPDFKLFYKS